jgi:hypothetical protein
MLKDAAQILAHLSTLLVAAAGLFWFVFSRGFKRRVQFDVDLQIIDVGNPEHFAAEVMLVLDNKGQREHRVHNLFCEVRQSSMITRDMGRYLKLENWVPKDDFYFIAAGVRQSFTRSFQIPKDAKLVRIRALFSYNKRRFDLTSLEKEDVKKAEGEKGIVYHELSRLFKVESRYFSMK